MFQKAKQQIHSFFQEVNKAVSQKKEIAHVLEGYLSENVTWQAAAPFEKMTGIDSCTNSFWKPLIHAFPDLEFQPYILMSGTYQGQKWVSTTGNMIGTFQNPFLEILPHHQPAWLRFGMLLHMENDKVQRGYVFLDILDLIRQAGFAFWKARGREIITPAPMTQDGILTHQTFDNAQGQASLGLVNEMLDALSAYDGKTLGSMGDLGKYWNSEKMMWYGSAGIGTTRGLKGFQKNHQMPFLKAFPKRGMKPKTDPFQFAQLGEGNYACDFGWPLMYAHHLGEDWLGLAPTNKEISLRVVDWWRLENQKLKENWVIIDMIDALFQLGIDVFEEMKKLKHYQQAVK